MELVSNCCGANIPLEGVDYSLCPKCKEHCEYIDLSLEDKHKTTLEILKDKLKSHDWTYEYSDDMRYWRAGNAQRKEINKLMASLYNTPLMVEAMLLYDEHNPFSKDD